MLQRPPPSCLRSATVQLVRHFVGELLIQKTVQGGELVVAGGVQEGEREQDVPQVAVCQLRQHTAQLQQQRFNTRALTL